MRIRKVKATVKQKKARVAAYCRVSTGRTDQEDSLEIQQNAYKRYIHTNPSWDFAGLYADTCSGLNAEKRPGFLHMIADAQQGKFDLILCKSISRFSRNIVECQRYTELLRLRNITVVFEKEKLRTDMPSSQLVFSLMCAIAQDESHSISENMHTAIRHRVEAGIYVPRKNQMLGYDVTKGKLTPDANAWIIRHIFNRYAEGAGLMEICRELNQLYAKRLRVDKPFTHQIVRHILCNESYVGDKLLQKQPPRHFLAKTVDPTQPFVTNYLRDDHVPIVSRTMWNMVQERLQYENATRSVGVRKQGNSHKLYGLLWCSECNEPYVRRKYSKRATTRAECQYYPIWCCRGRLNGNGCKNPNIKEEELLVLQTPGRYIVSSDGKVMENVEGQTYHLSFCL